MPQHHLCTRVPRRNLDAVHVRQVARDHRRQVLVVAVIHLVLVRQNQVVARHAVQVVQVDVKKGALMFVAKLAQQAAPMHAIMIVDTIADQCARDKTNLQVVLTALSGV